MFSLNSCCELCGITSTSKSFLARLGIQLREANYVRFDRDLLWTEPFETLHGLGFFRLDIILLSVEHLHVVRRAWREVFIFKLRLPFL